MPHSRFANHLKTMTLTPYEKEIISGCLLGDGTLSKSGKHYRLRIEHNFRHLEYVVWKRDQLRRLCVSDIQAVTEHSSFRFGTVGHPEITEMRQIWYSPLKRIPKDIRLTALMAAIWFMDDGTKHRDTVDISVHSFPVSNIENLRNQFLSLGIKTTINSDSKGSRLYILKESYLNFKKLVKPYIIECMAYKLP